MRIASWNVNSLNVRLPHVLKLLETEQVDVLALQETKLPDERFPSAVIKDAGFTVRFAGQNTYNGVAILGRRELVDIQSGIPGFDDVQQRVLAATMDGVRIVNVYVPNGQEVGSEKYEYKFRWLNALRDWLSLELVRHPHLIVLGDFNIAPADIDVHDPNRWHEKIMCSTAEREFFRSLLQLGLVDAVRSVHPDQPMHTWWDYRLAAYRRGWGLRIDHILATPNLNPVDAGVLVRYRELERPSDHAPVWVEFA